MRVMFQGVTSGTGKSTLVALACLHLYRSGVSVTPFKTENLSLNSHVCEDGSEISISQTFQAWAAGIEPDRRMNPVLIKPTGSGCQVILDGRPWGDVSGRRDDSLQREVMDLVRRDLDSLSEDFEAIVIEGMGSPVEINLGDRDLANMRTAHEAGAPVILVGDIERGGVFAGLYGTYLLMSERDRGMLRGFVINRFRGDASILGPGIEELERLMGVPCMGILPYLRATLPAEDSLSLTTEKGPTGFDDVRDMWTSELNRMLDAVSGHVDWDAMLAPRDA